MNSEIFPALNTTCTNILKWKCSICVATIRHFPPLQIKLIWELWLGQCFELQLNEYEKDPYFLQLRQNMATIFLFTFVFFPVLTWIYLFCAKNCFVLMLRTIFGTKQVNSGKNTKVNKQLVAMFWLNWRKYWSLLYSLSCNTGSNSSNFV